MGCFFRKSRHGTLTFVLTYKGRRWWEGTRQGYDDPGALEKAKAVRHFVISAMKSGTLEADYPRLFPHGNRHDWLAPKPGRAPSLRTFAEAFKAERVPPLYRRSYARALTSSLDRWVVPTVGHLPMDQVVQTHAVMVRERLLTAGRSVKYARNVLAHMQAMFTAAQKRHVVSENPCAGLDWPRQPTTDPQPFSSWAQVNKVLAQLRKRDVTAYRFVLALAHTGMRPSEAAGLFWGDVDLDGDGRIQIRRSRDQGRVNATKTTASQRTLSPLSPALLAELRAMRPLRAEPTTPVFTGPTGRPINQARIYERKWLPALTLAKVAPRRMYELRHTFISLGLSADPPANPQWIAEYTGTSLEMLRRTYGRFIRAADTDPLAWLTVSPEAKGNRQARKTPKPAGRLRRVSDGS